MEAFLAMNEHNRSLTWRLSLRASIADVFALLATDRGRESFWVERSTSRGDFIVLEFPSGQQLECLVFEQRPPIRFVLSYFEDTELRFELSAEGSGTAITLRERGLSAEHFAENRAGWVSVLLNLKARADFGIDLRNHDRERTWAQGYPDN